MSWWVRRSRRRRAEGRGGVRPHVTSKPFLTAVIVTASQIKQLEVVREKLPEIYESGTTLNIWRSLCAKSCPNNRNSDGRNREGRAGCVAFG